MPSVANKQESVAGIIDNQDADALSFHDFLPIVNESSQDPLVSDLNASYLIDGDQSILLDDNANWVNLDHAIDRLSPGIEADQASESDLQTTDSSDYMKIYSADHLTGLTLARENSSETLIDSNHSPLLRDVYLSDGLLSREESIPTIDVRDQSNVDDNKEMMPQGIDIDALSNDDFYSIDFHQSIEIESNSHHSSEQVFAQSDDFPEVISHDGSLIDDANSLGESHVYSFLEDHPFSLDISDVFPVSDDIVSVELKPSLGQNHEPWLALDSIKPDSTVTDRLVIEPLYMDELGNSLNPLDVKNLSPGSTLKIELVVSDTRPAGLGLIGLELDSSWNPNVLDFLSVTLTDSLPLFRNEGELSTQSDALTGLGGGSLPNGGVGEYLGDQLRDHFATLYFQVKPEALSQDIDFKLLPRKFPASKELHFESEDVLAVNSNHLPLTAITGYPNQQHVGEHSYTVVAHYANGETWKKELNFVIENSNDAPLSLSQTSISGYEDSLLDIDVNNYFYDPDLSLGDDLQFSLLLNEPEQAKFDWLSLDTDNGILTARPDYAEVGSWVLPVIATDSYGLSAIADINLDIHPVNDVPIYAGGDLPDVYLQANSRFEFDFPIHFFSDEEEGTDLNHSITIEGVSADSKWIHIDPNSLTITGTTPVNIGDTYNVVLSAEDSGGLSSSTSFQIETVSNEFNRAPYLTEIFPTSQIFSEGELVEFDLKKLFNDEDTILLGDQLNYEYIGPDWLILDSETSVVSGIPSNENVGTSWIQFFATDLKGSKASGGFNLLIDNVNQSPERLTDPVQSSIIRTGSTFSLDMDQIFSDIDVINGDWLSYSLSVKSSSSNGIPDWLSWNSSSGQLTLTPGDDDRGLLSLLFEAKDSHQQVKSYKLDLGIVGEDSLVEVNQALQSLRLKTDSSSLIDIENLFLGLNGITDLDYKLELFKVDKNDQTHEISAFAHEWIKIIDKSIPYTPDENIIIQPRLTLLQTGEEILVENLSDLPSGTQIQMTVDATDYRSFTQNPGLIGVDLLVAWDGLQLMTTSTQEINQRFSSDLPLFRDISFDQSDHQKLRFTGASLPSFRLGEAIGDDPNEYLLSLDFTLEDPSKPVTIDLQMIDEKSGGLGYAMADSSSVDERLNIGSISTNPLPALQINPSTNERGDYLLKLSSSIADSASNQLAAEYLASDSTPRGREDNVSQLVNIYVANGLNSGPIALPINNQLSYKEGGDYLYPLDDLFVDQDDQSLSYHLDFDPNDEQYLNYFRDNVHVDYQDGQAYLRFAPSTLPAPVRGSIVVNASDGNRSSQQILDVAFTPSSDVFTLDISPNHPPLQIDQLAGLGDLYGTTTMHYPDTNDSCFLVIRSNEAIDLNLARDCFDEYGFNDEIFRALESSVITSIQQKEDAYIYMVQISKIDDLIGRNSSEYDLNEILLSLPEAIDADSFTLEVRTVSHLNSDPTGVLYGFNQSPNYKAEIPISLHRLDQFISPYQQRVLRNHCDQADIEYPSSSHIVADDETPSTLFAWKNKSLYDKTFTGVVEDASSIVALSVSHQDADITSDSIDQPLPIVEHLTVLSLTDERFAESDPSNELSFGEEIVDHWDPIWFKLSTNDTSSPFTDIDPLRAGTQVEVTIDLTASDLSPDAFNAYRKFVSTKTLQDAASHDSNLFDLDGNLITQSGWYDFTQRTDSNGDFIGDGARFIVDTHNGISRLSKMVLTLTDNQFGDNNFSLGVIEDPGMPVRIVNRLAIDAQASLVPQSIGVTPVSSALIKNNVPVAGNVSRANYSPTTSTRSSDNISSAAFRRAEALQSSHQISNNSSRDVFAFANNNLNHGTSKGNTQTQPLSLTKSSTNNPSISQYHDHDNPGSEYQSAPLSRLGNISAGRTSRSSRNPLDLLSNWANSLIELSDKPSTLVGIVLGFIATPLFAERGSKSLITSGIGTSIHVHRRDPDIQAKWTFDILDLHGHSCPISLILKSGRFLLRSAPSTSDGAIDDSSSIEDLVYRSYDESPLWTLLQHVKLPGEMIFHIDRQFQALLGPCLDSIDLMWTDWVQSLCDQCVFDGDDLAIGLVSSFVNDLNTACSIDPSLADAMILIQFIDCYQKLGKTIPFNQ